MIYELAAIVIISIAVLTDMLLIFFWLSNFKEYPTTIDEYPTVDVLIAARNEEGNMAQCLEAICQLDYPVDKLKVWIGNDASTDQTWKIIQEFEAKYSHIKGIQITNKVIKGNGKANVLDQIISLGHNKWLFMTDADITVSKQWIKALLAGGKVAQADLITGTSLAEGNGWLAKFQRLDWLFATSMLKSISDLGVPVATMGNNMAVLRKVYLQVGGFKSLPFSVTEDLELFKAIKKKHTTVHLFSQEVLNKSTPQNSVIELLIQRKRWMRGAFELPYQLLSILIIQAIYFPSILVLMFFNPILGSFLWFAKWILKFTYQRVTAKKLAENTPILDSFATEVFTMIFSLISLVYYFWPGKIYWKGRTY